MVNWATSSLAESPAQSAKLYLKSPEQPQKTADILRRHLQFSREMTSEERAQEFHTDDVTLPMQVWLELLIGYGGSVVSVLIVTAVN